MCVYNYFDDFVKNRTIVSKFLPGNLKSKRTKLLFAFAHKYMNLDVRMRCSFDAKMAPGADIT